MTGNGAVGKRLQVDFRPVPLRAKDQRAHVLVAVDERGLVCAHQVCHDVPDSDAVVRLLSSAQGAGQLASHIVLGPVLANQLEALRRDLPGRAWSVGPTPGTDEAFREFLGGRPPPPKPWFSLQDPPKVAAFLFASERFLAAEPWENIEPDVFVEVRLDGGPARFVTLLGDAGEDFGYLLTKSWAAAQRLLRMADVYDGDYSKLPELEGVTLATPANVARDDVDELVEWGMFLDIHDAPPFLVPQRYTPSGPKPAKMPIRRCRGWPPRRRRRPGS